MSKKKPNNEREIYDLKTNAVTYVKRYLIILLISMPIIMFINYFLSNELGLNSIAVVFITLALLLLALFIGLIVFSKKDEKRKENSTKESERDPFAD